MENLISNDASGVVNVQLIPQDYIIHKHQNKYSCSLSSLQNEQGLINEYLTKIKILQTDYICGLNEAKIKFENNIQCCMEIDRITNIKDHINYIRPEDSDIICPFLNCNSKAQSTECIEVATRRNSFHL